MMATAIRILYVDDEPDLLGIGKMFLEESGDFTVTTAISASVALRLLEQEKFDAIISDYQMPGMNGIQFLVEVRTRFGPIPFILFTGRGREEIVIQAINSGVDFYIQKGGEPGSQFAELSHKVKSAASRKRAVDALAESERVHTTMISNLPGFVYRCANDSNWTMEYISDGCREITGYTPNELLNNNTLCYNDIVQKEFQITLWDQVQKFLEKREVFSVEYPIITKTGETCWVWERGQGIHSSDGRLLYLEGFITDITGRKTAEASRDQQLLFTTALNEIAEVIVTKDNSEDILENTNRIIGETLKLDRALIYDVLFDENQITGLCEWLKEKDPYIAATKGKYPLDMFLSPFTEIKRTKKYLKSHFNAVNEHFIKDGSGKILHENFKIKSLIWFPFAFDEHGYHVFTLNQILNQREWTQEEIAFLESVAKQVSLALNKIKLLDERKRAEDALHKKTEELHAAYEQLTASEEELRQNIDTLGRNERASRESEEKFRSLAESSPDYIMRYDHLCRHTYVNPATLRVTGLTEGQIIGKTHRECGFDEAQSRFYEENITGVFETGKPYQTQFVWDSVDGRVVLDWMLTPEFSEDKTVQSVLGVSRDITQIKKGEEELLKKNEELNASYQQITAAEEELHHNIDELTRQEQKLKESKRELADIIEFLPDATFVIDRQGIVIAWNRAMEKMTGIGKDAMIGKGDHAYTIPFYGERRQQLLDLIDVDDEKLQAKYQYVTRKGNTLYAEVFSPALYGGKGAYVWATGAPLFDGSGDRIGAIESIRDITEWKKTDAARKESEKKYRDIFENSVAGLFKTAPDGRMIDANDSLARMYGYSGAIEILKAGITVGQLYANPDDREEVLHILAEKGRVEDYETPHLKRDGTRFWVSITARTIRNEDGTVLFYEGTNLDITGRKMAEDALRESRERLKFALEGTNDGIWDVRMDTGAVYLSPRGCEILGYTPEELPLVAQTWSQLVHPDDLPATTAALNAYLEGHVPIFDIEQRLKTKSGNWKWIQVRGKAISQDENGAPIRMVGTHIDITERRGAHEALKEREERLKEAQRVGHIGSWDLNVVTGDLQWSDECYRIYGFRPQEFVPSYEKFRSILYTEDLAFVQEQVDAALNNDKHYDIDFRFVRPDGEIGWIHCEGEVMRDADAKPLRFFGTQIDITERKRAEEAMHESEARYRTLVEHIPQKIFMKDRNSRYVSINENFANDLGIHPDKIVGKSDADLFPVKLAAKYRADDVRIMNTGQTEEFEERYLNEGKETWVHTIKTVVKDKNGEISGVCGVFWDITVSKLAQVELQKKSEELAAAGEELKSQFDALAENERAMHKSDAQKIAILNGITTNIAFVDKDLKILWANKIAAESVNKSPTEMAGHTCHSFWGDPARPCENCPTLKVFETKQSAHIIQHTTDGRIWDEKGEPVFDVNGNLIGVVEIAEDITERKKAEEALKESEERFRNVIEATGEYVFEIDTHGVITFVSDRVKDNLGYEPQELIGKTPFDVMVSQEEVARVSAIFGEYIRNKLPIRRMEHNCLSKDGRELMLTVTALPIFDAAGELKGYQGTVEDITDKKRAEENIRQQTDAMEAAIDGLAILDNNQNYSYVNKAHAAIYGYDNAIEFIGTSWRILYDPDELQRFEREIMPELGQKGHYQGRAVGKKKDGSTFPQEISLTTLENGGLICVVRDITERKLAEERLKESEERYLSLFDRSLDCIYIHDLEGNFIDANPAALKLLGYTKEDIPHVSFTSLISGEQLNKARETIRAIVETGSHSDVVEYRLQAKNGKFVDIETKGSLIHHNKKPYAIFGIARDISERKRTDESLMESEEKFRATIGQSIDGILIADGDFRIIEWNTSQTAIYGYTRDEMLGKPLWEFQFATLPKEKRSPVVLEKMKQSMLNLRTSSDSAWMNSLHDFEVMSMDGRGKTVQISTFPIVFRDSIYFGSFSRNITDLKMVEKELHESEEQLHNFISNLPVGLYRNTAGPLGKVLMANPYIARMHGYDTLEEFLQKPTADMYAKPEERVTFSDQLISKGSIFGREIHLKRKNNELFWGRISAVAVRNQKGDVQYFDGFIEDISDKKRAEEAIQLANKKLNLLSSITRHDINNQLVVLLGYLTILQKKQPDPALNEYFQNTTTAAQRIANMIQFTREYEDIGVKAPAWQDCRTLVDTATKQATLGQVMVKNDLTAGMEVFADPLIVKVFYNLMDNAIRYGGKITTIRFSVGEYDGEHLIVCEDNGVGVLADEKERIFDRGFGKNTGMGLFLSREILSITGITIRETGESGKGARFEMVVPKGMWRNNPDTNEVQERKP